MCIVNDKEITMNKQISKLIKQATTIRYSGPGEIEEFDKEKFAELLIKECALIAFHNVVNLSSIADAEDVEANIKEHFGVDE